MRPNRSKGVALIAAVFILVILATLSGFIISIANISFGSTILGIQGTRALFAARSGLEWGVYQVVSNPLICPPTTTLTLTQGGTKGFSVQVTCTMRSVTEGPTTYNIFQVNAVSDFGSFGDNDYVSRQMSVSATLGN